MEQEKITWIWSLDFLIKLAFSLKAGPNSSLKVKLTYNGKYNPRGITLYRQGLQIPISLCCIFREVGSSDLAISEMRASYLELSHARDASSIFSVSQHGVEKQPRCKT